MHMDLSQWKTCSRLMLSNFHILLTFLIQNLCFVVIYDAMRFI